MKKTALFIFLLFCLLSAANSQNCYWVFLTDKAGTTFDPYSYFDAKAIERYRVNNADLYDISNYPLNEGYVSQVNALATEEVGQSRWLNATAVMATPEQIARIRQLPFVRTIVQLESNMHLAVAAVAADLQSDTHYYKDLQSDDTKSSANGTKALHKQIVRMKGKAFRDKGINGKGVRIAVLDGGFPQVNTHVAFKHLRDNHQIVKTWNFPNKKEDVYGWNSHGLMTLSCIAAREDGTDLGMATGAEFLLARTEIEAEPFKEEVWWQMGMEWADKNGAQIISSSLGYGKDRYYTKDMDGTSFVAKAGNMAARKGILVCNSAGNEGDDKSWYTIITPADADSVLCVGGINPSLTNYELTTFSSYGPSADGRQKPNVCAFAYARTANTGKSNDKYTVVPGTSFSCPLVAGFAACALQCRPGIKTMDLFHEIEKSADLYPYCDYSYGYGVPQADYFTNTKDAVLPTFKFKTTSDGHLHIVPTINLGQCRIFFKNGNADGTIYDYRKWELEEFTTSLWIDIPSGNVVTVNLNGYTESYQFNAPNIENGPMMAELRDNNGQDVVNPVVVEEKQHFSTRLHEDNKKPETYFLFGVSLKTQDKEIECKTWSPALRVGIRKTYQLCKSYGIGYAIEYGNNSFRFGDEANKLDTLVGYTNIDAVFDKEIQKHRIDLGQIGLEVYQRVRFIPGGMFHRGWHWDLGVYGNWNHNSYSLKGAKTNGIASNETITLNNVNVLKHYRWNYGVTTRLTRDWLGIYARYNFTKVEDDQITFPRLEVGLQLSF